MPLFAALVCPLVALTACASGGDQGDDGFVLSAGNEGTGTGTDTDADEIGSDGATTDTTTETTTDTTGTTTDTTETTTDTTETTTDTTETTGEPPLPCDPKFDLITPNPPTAGQPFTARFSDNVGHVYIGMGAVQIEGVGSPMAGNEVISGNNPYHWTYTITGHGAGIVELTFTSNMGSTVLGTCQLHVN